MTDRQSFCIFVFYDAEADDYCAIRCADDPRLARTYLPDAWKLKNNLSAPERHVSDDISQLCDEAYQRWQDKWNASQNTPASEEYLRLREAAVRYDVFFQKLKKMQSDISNEKARE